LDFFCETWLFGARHRGPLTSLIAQTKRPDVATLATLHNVKSLGHVVEWVCFGAGRASPKSASGRIKSWMPEDLRPVRTPAAIVHV
jgi:hypothetical protein